MLNLFDHKLIFADYACPACNLCWKDKGFHVFPQHRVLCPEHKARLVAMLHRQDVETDTYALLPWIAFAANKSQWG